MLPEIRHDEYLFSVPKFDINKEDIEDFNNELKGFHDNFRDCFSRSESRDHFFKYMVGQFSELERKSIEPIALAVKDGNIRAMQHFVSDVFWHEERLLIKYHSLLADDFGDPNGVLIFDESGFIKKGDDSSRSRQTVLWGHRQSGELSSRCFRCLRSPHGYALVDKRLFIPEKWFTDEYSQRRGNVICPKTSLS